MSGHSNLDRSARLPSELSLIADDVLREHDDAHDAGNALLSNDKFLSALEGTSTPGRPTSTCEDGDASGMHENVFELPLRIGPVRLGAPKLDLSLVELDDLMFDGARKVQDVAMPSGCAAISAAPDDPMARPTIRINDGYVDYVYHRYVRCWIDMRDRFDDYQSKCLTAKLRSDIRRQTRRFLQHTGEADLDVRFYRTPAEVSDFDAHAEQVSATTFQEQKGGFGWPRDEAFKRSLMRLAEEGGCFGSVMFANEKPISYQYMTKRNKRLLGKFIGFDPKYQKYSPGKVHMLSCIQYLFDDSSCEIYDFAGGGFRYMIEFSSDRASCADTLRLSFHPRHLAIIGAHMALASITKMSTNCCDLLGLRERLRRKLRGR